MGEWIPLTTPAGPVRGWLARPEQPPLGAVVVVQEIFGVNPHIRRVTDQFAKAGFTAMAPALFDPVQPDVELGYDDTGVSQGRDHAASLGFERALQIVSASARWLRESGHRVGVVGFCWGGTVAMLAALRLGLPSVSYYGARNLPFLDDPDLTATPKAPVMFHFGEHDASITPEAVLAHRRALPGMEVFTYPADHAFNRDVSPKVFHAASAALARQRSLAFLAGQLR